jgi:hypothetical protein
MVFLQNSFTDRSVIIVDLLVFPVKGTQFDIATALRAGDT